MDHCVYVLVSQPTGKRYIGMSGNLDQRLKEHQNGEVRSTRPFRPWMLVFVQLCNSKQEARKLELFLKSGFGREILDEIIPR